MLLARGSEGKTENKSFVDKSKLPVRSGGDVFGFGDGGKGQRKRDRQSKPHPDPSFSHIRSRRRSAIIEDLNLLEEYGLGLAVNEFGDFVIGLNEVAADRI